MHHGLAVLHTGDGTIDKALEAAEEHLTQAAGPKLAFEDKTADEALVVARRVLRGYFEFWGAQGDLWTPLQQEVQFCVEVGSEARIYLAGRSDNLSMIDGSLWIVDYKTAAAMDPRNLLKYEMDIQLTAYIYGISKHLTEESQAVGGPPIRVQGAVVDLLVKTKVPQYARETFTRTDEELAEFEAEFVEYGNRIREQLQRSQDGENWKMVFPKNTEHCFRYSTCPYRDICLKDTEIRRQAYDQRVLDYMDENQKRLEKETV